MPLPLPLLANLANAANCSWLIANGGGAVIDAGEATAAEGTVCGEEVCDDGSDGKGRRAATLAGIPLNLCIMHFGQSIKRS